MRNHMEAGWFYSPRQIGHYLATRFTSLKPAKNKLQNPYTVLKDVTRHQWLLFLCGFLGWTWDAFDFFTVSLCVTEIAKDFQVPITTVTWGITVTLMFRSVGALFFGLFADRYGRKWPMVINLVLFIILELGAGFSQTSSQFIALRALYGIAMGGLFGPAAATALEDLPYEARGILSGLFEMGYAFGYLIAAAFYRALVPTTPHGWRSLFWFGAGPPVLIILFRLWLPETNHFQVALAERGARSRNAHQGDTGQHARAMGLRTFLRDSGKALRENWVLFIYLVVLMTGLNSISHGSEDFYPTFLKNQVGMDATQVTVITVIGMVGGIIGGTLIGWLSTFFGRRLTMIVTCIVGGALVPSYTFVRGMNLIAPVFFQQFCVLGIWGVIPIHLMELSPPALRTLMLGFTYQLGNLASSASSTIQSIIGSRYPLPPTPSGKPRFDYGRVIAIFLGAVWAFILFFLFWGPEISAEERAEHAEAALYLETMRAQGASLAEIGEQMAMKQSYSPEHATDVVQDVEKTQETALEHV